MTLFIRFSVNLSGTHRGARAPNVHFLASKWPLDVDHCYQDRKSVYDATRTWNFAGSFELALSMVERVSICPRQFDIGL